MHVTHTIEVGGVYVRLADHSFLYFGSYDAPVDVQLDIEKQGRVMRLWVMESAGVDEESFVLDAATIWQEEEVFAGDSRRWRISNSDGEIMDIPEPSCSAFYADDEKVAEEHYHAITEERDSLWLSFPADKVIPFMERFPDAGRELLDSALQCAGCRSPERENTVASATDLFAERQRHQEWLARYRAE